ncbi:alkaline phosphatase family protein [Methyloprofundus sp.]|uniref:alkaline phosphatase family protein n=1 Tax=Methyloprofundus sp. TaxID=2020875 RepID=UPI003D13BE27
MLGFLQNYYNHHGGDIGVELEILDTYDYDQLPILNTLAKSYGVSDEWFSSIPSQTSINRAFSICGNSVGNMPTSMQGISEEMAMVNNHYMNDEYLPATFTGKTIWEVLSESPDYHPADWKFYYSSKYLDGLFGTYEYSYSYYLFKGFQDLLKKPGMADKYQPIEQFYLDAQAGTLPRFSYLEPKYTNDLIGSVGMHGNDYHPPGNVAWGEKFLASLYAAVKGSPDWEDILFVVAWDEHGGTFDHIIPPNKAVDPSPSVPHEDHFDFKRFGVRVPMLFISPWVKENTVIRSSSANTPFDHTSWLATLLDWFDLKPQLLGARTKVAPKFDAVISDCKRPATDLPPVWDCQSNSQLADIELSVRKAAEVARVMSAHDPSSDPLALLKDSLQGAKTEKELASFYGQWMKQLNT